jgi:hypothetical protein
VRRRIAINAPTRMEKTAARDGPKYGQPRPPMKEKKVQKIAMQKAMIAVAK